MLRAQGQREAVISLSWKSRLFQYVFTAANVVW